MRLYFDTCAFINFIEGPKDSQERFISIVSAAAQFGISIVTSEITLIEVLVKPLQQHDFNLIVAYNNLLAGRGVGQIETALITREILGDAARIRAHKASVKLPDAIHIATAEIMQCDCIVTGDSRWSGATTISLEDFNRFNVLAYIEMFS